MWAESVAAIKDASRTALGVLEVLAWLGAEGLPEIVLGPLASDPYDERDALSVLASYSMVTRRSGAVSMHPLVQSAVRNSVMANGRADAVRATAARLLLTAAPDDPINNPTGWPMWAALLPHIQALVGDMPDDHESVAALDLQEGAALYLQYQGNIDAAITIFEQLLIDRERILGPEHPDTLTARANLATAYQQAGRTSDAITFFEQLLVDSERVLGSEHPQTLTARANLATAYQQAGRTSDAITLLEQVLADRVRVLGSEHPHTLTARANLAAYRQAGHTERSEPGAGADPTRGSAGGGNG